MKTTSAEVGNEPVEGKRLDEVLVAGAVRKYIYVLPSGRKLKVVVEDERELQGELSSLQPKLVS
jgi:hypothetical protein